MATPISDAEKKDGQKKRMNRNTTSDHPPKKTKIVNVNESFYSNVDFVSTPKLITSCIQALTERQRADVVDIGFGGMLHLRIGDSGKVSKSVYPFLLERYENMVLSIEHGLKFEATSSLFYEVLALPTKDKKICGKKGAICRGIQVSVVDEGIKKQKQLMDVWRPLLSISPGKYFASAKSFMSAIEKLAEGGDLFKKLFVLFTMCLFLAPLSDKAILLDILCAVEQVHNLAHFDWCAYVANQLNDTVHKMKNKVGLPMKSKPKCGGCFLALMIGYFHRVHMGPELGTKIPYIMHWDDESLRKRIKMEVSSKSRGCLKLPRTPPELEEEVAMPAKQQDALMSQTEDNQANFDDQIEDVVQSLRQTADGLHATLLNFDISDSFYFVIEAEIRSIASKLFKYQRGGTPAQGKEAAAAVEITPLELEGVNIDPVLEEKDTVNTETEVASAPAQGATVNINTESVQHYTEAEEVQVASTPAQGDTVNTPHLEDVDSPPVPGEAYFESLSEKRLQLIKDHGINRYEPFTVESLKKKGLCTKDFPEVVMSYLDYCFTDFLDKEFTTIAHINPGGPIWEAFFFKEDAEALRPFSWITGTSINIYATLLNMEHVTHDPNPYRFYFDSNVFFFIPVFHAEHITLCVVNLCTEKIEWFDNMGTDVDFSRYSGLHKELIKQLYNFLVSKLYRRSEEILKFPHVYKDIPTNRDEAFDCGVYTMAYMQWYRGEERFILDLDTREKRSKYRAQVLLQIIFNPYNEVLEELKGNVSSWLDNLKDTSNQNTSKQKTSSQKTSKSTKRKTRK